MYKPDGIDGKLRVHTSSGSIYLVDVDRGELSRLASMDEPAGGWEDTSSVTMRRDGETLGLLAIPQLAVGTPAVFDIEPLGGAGTDLTRRTTTPVTRIVPVTA